MVRAGFVHKNKLEMDLERLKRFGLAGREQAQKEDSRQKGKTGVRISILYFRLGDRIE